MEKRDRSEYFKQYREKNREKLRENYNKWVKNNPDKISGYHKKYMADPEHREKCNKRRREYYQENIEHIRDLNRVNQAKCRAKKKVEKENNNEK